MNAENAQAYLSSLLCGDASDEKVLSAMMKRLEGVRSTKVAVELLFTPMNDEEQKITLSEAEGDETDISSLSALRASVRIEYEHLGGGYTASNARYDVPDYLIDDDEVMGDDPDAVVAVFDCGQNLIVAHPTKKNATKEPALYFIDHEDGAPQAIKDAKSLTARQVLLRLLARAVGAGEYLEAVQP